MKAESEKGFHGSLPFISGASVIGARFDWKDGSRAAGSPWRFRVFFSGFSGRRDEPSRQDARLEIS